MELRKSKSLGAILVLFLSLLFVTGVAGASVWGGNNGTITLSFSKDQPLESAMNSEAVQEGPLIVDLYAWITDVEPVAYHGESFLNIGGFELMLTIEGSEGTITAGDFEYRAFDVRKEPEQFQVGVWPALRLVEEGTLLVHWQILFTERPGPTVFRLDPTGLPSVAELGGCNEGDTWALYTGSDESGQSMLIMGADYRPAFLNFGPVVGEKSWRDVGVCEAVETE